MIIRSVTAVFAFFTLGMSQHVERIEMQTMQLKEKLRLTEEQTVKVRHILTHHIESASKDRITKEGNRRERLKASVALMEKTDREIEKILSKEQKLKYEQYKEDRRKEMRERMKERQLKQSFSHNIFLELL